MNSFIFSKNIVLKAIQDPAGELFGRNEGETYWNKEALMRDAS